MQICKILTAGFLAAMLTGCISVDYVGQTYTRDNPAPIIWFNDAKSVPPNDYQPIGRATVKATADYDQEQVREAILDEAEKHGVDAVQIVSAQTVEVRKREISDPGNSNFGTRTQPQSRTADYWEPYDSFGKPSKRQVHASSVMEFHVKALFLVKKERYEEAMRKFAEEQRATIEVTPMPNSPAAKKAQ